MPARGRVDGGEGAAINIYGDIRKRNPIMGDFRLAAIIARSNRRPFAALCFTSSAFVPPRPTPRPTPFSSSAPAIYDLSRV
jgi:hypothetical protein